MPKPSKSDSPRGTGVTGWLPPLASLRVPPGDLVAYIVVARFHQPFHWRLTGAPPWMPTEVARTEVCELMHQDYGWHPARRLVLMTSLLHAVPPLAVWRDYNGRAGSENVIKELDAHFGLPQLCLKKFWASEAALSRAVLAYNVCVLFQRHPGWQERVSAGTLRFRTVAGLIAGRQELFDELATALSLATA